MVSRIRSGGRGCPMSPDVEIDTDSIRVVREAIERDAQFDSCLVEALLNIIDRLQKRAADLERDAMVNAKPATLGLRIPLEVEK